MTTLTIIPNYEKKRLKLVGTVAAGEHVAVTIVGGGEWAQSGTLRLRALFGGKTVAVFPYYTEQREVDGQTVEADSWSGDEDATCELNLNMISAEKMLRFGGECLWVLDDPANHTLYGTGEFYVGKWPKHRPVDVPYDLDSYPDAVRELSSNVESLSTQLQLLSQNKVDKVSGKSLTTNDYTNEDKQKLDGVEVGAQKNVGVEFTQAEKTKLGGIANGANNYTLPPATAGTLGGVKQGTGCEIAADGTLNVTGGGTADSVAWDDVTDKPSAFPPSSHKHLQSEVNGLVAALEGKYEMPSGGIPATDLAQAVQTALSAIPGKASAADRIAEAELVVSLPDSAFPITYTDIDPAPQSRTITGADDVEFIESEYGFIAKDKQNPGYGGLNGFAFFDKTTGVFFGADAPIEDLSFNGSATATLDFMRALAADRTVNLITATDETSIDIELPAAVTVDGVIRARDFIFDIDNSRNGSDLALEFVSLGTGDEHGFAFATDSADSIGEIMTIGAGECVRLYFTETSYWTSGASLPLPVIHVARVTLGDFVTSTTPAQGGN